MSFGNFHILYHSHWIFLFCFVIFYSQKMWKYFCLSISSANITVNLISINKFICMCICHKSNNHKVAFIVNLMCIFLFSDDIKLFSYKPVIHYYVILENSFIWVLCFFSEIWIITFWILQLNCHVSHSLGMFPGIHRFHTGKLIPISQLFLAT